MTKFEDQLFSELMDEHGAALARIEVPEAGRSRRPGWLVAGSLAAAGAVGAGLALFGAAAPAAAYSVTQNADGTTSVVLHDMSGIQGANSALEKSGDNAFVVPLRAGCPDLSTFVSQAPMNTRDIAEDLAIDWAGGEIRFHARDIPAGDILLIAVQAQKDGWVWVAVIVKSGPIPSCVSDGVTTIKTGPAAGVASAKG